ncbi:MAG: phospholipase, partial [Burkholderiales bacterium]|nr:phospholipase [Burkholderiales bacterium]
WVRTLPGAKLPDRQDFATWVDDEAGRERLWRRAVAESQRLADEFAALVTGGGPIEALPLAGAAGLG